MRNTEYLQCNVRFCPSKHLWPPEPLVPQSIIWSPSYIYMVGWLPKPPLNNPQGSLALSTVFILINHSWPVYSGLISSHSLSVTVVHCSDDFGNFCHHQLFTKNISYIITLINTEMTSFYNHKSEVFAVVDISKGTHVPHGCLLLTPYSKRILVPTCT